jgi:hypothetical protein
MEKTKAILAKMEQLETLLLEAVEGGDHYLAPMLRKLRQEQLVVVRQRLSQFEAAAALPTPPQEEVAPAE